MDESYDIQEICDGIAVVLNMVFSPASCDFGLSEARQSYECSTSTIATAILFHDIRGWSTHATFVEISYDFTSTAFIYLSTTDSRATHIFISLLHLSQTPFCRGPAKLVRSRKKKSCVVCKGDFKINNEKTSWAYCIKLLPEKNSGYFNCSFVSMVKSQWEIMLTRVSDFTRGFSPVKVLLCNRPLEILSWSILVYLPEETSFSTLLLSARQTMGPRQNPFRLRPVRMRELMTYFSSRTSSETLFSSRSVTWFSVAGKRE